MTISTDAQTYDYSPSQKALCESFNKPLNCNPATQVPIGYRIKMCQDLQANRKNYFDTLYYSEGTEDEESLNTEMLNESIRNLRRKLGCDRL